MPPRRKFVEVDMSQHKAKTFVASEKKPSGKQKNNKTKRDRFNSSKLIVYFEEELKINKDSSIVARVYSYGNNKKKFKLLPRKKVMVKNKENKLYEQERTGDKVEMPYITNLLTGQMLGVMIMKALEELSK